MFAHQGEARLGVVEGFAVGVFAIVTGQAVFAKLQAVGDCEDVIHFQVAGDADGGIKLKVGGVTVEAGKGGGVVEFLVAGEGEPGDSVWKVV